MTGTRCLAQRRGTLALGSQISAQPPFGAKITMLLRLRESRHFSLRSCGATFVQSRVVLRPVTCKL